MMTTATSTNDNDTDLPFNSTDSILVELGSSGGERDGEGELPVVALCEVPCEPENVDPLRWLCLLLWLGERRLLPLLLPLLPGATLEFCRHRGLDAHAR
jgi:hypothetical protein